MADIDDLFLPFLFAVFTLSLLTVLHACYSLKLHKESVLWRRIMLLLLALSATAFVLQGTSSWKKDFLHQAGLVSTPVLWERVLSGFIVAHKLTIDTTENYWITSQLISFVLPLVAFINMQRRHMDIPGYVIFAYLGLGLTGSYGGMFALFLYHFYNSVSSSWSMQYLTFREQCAQVVSSIGGCGAIIFLKDSTLFQLKLALFPTLCLIFVLPFLPPLINSMEKSSNTLKENSFGLYFFTLLGLFLAVHHYYLTYLVFEEWMSYKAFALVAFAHAYQYAATVDVISCMVILSTFISLEFCLFNLLNLKFPMVFLTGILFTLIMSPGGLFAFFLGYKEYCRVKGFTTLDH